MRNCTPSTAARPFLSASRWPDPLPTSPRCDTIALEVIACPFCSCSCCRWQLSSARRAVSNNPPPRIRPGLFLCPIAAGRPRSPQEPPSAPQSRAPVPMYARHPLAPSAPVLARRGYACTVPAMPAEYATPLTMPLQGAMSGFYISHTSDRGNAFSHALRPPGVPCGTVRIAPPRRLHQHPAEKPPGGPKGPARRRAGFRHRFRAGFDSVFARAREGIPIGLYVPDSRWHSRLP